MSPARATAAAHRRRLRSSARQGPWPETKFSRRVRKQGKDHRSVPRPQKRLRPRRAQIAGNGAINDAVSAQGTPTNQSKKSRQPTSPRASAPRRMQSRRTPRERGSGEKPSSPPAKSSATRRRQADFADSTARPGENGPPRTRGAPDGNKSGGRPERASHAARGTAMAQGQGSTPPGRLWGHQGSTVNPASDRHIGADFDMGPDQCARPRADAKPVRMVPDFCGR